MEAIILKAFSFFFMIILAYALKRKGILKVEDSKALARILMNITLPAAIMTSFDGFVMDSSLLTIILWGLLANIVMLVAGIALSRRKTNADKAFYMINCPSYNIGNFTIPFASSFIGATGTVVACLFDAGNAIMCLGATYMVTSLLLDTSGRKLTLLGMGKSLLHIPSFVIYVIMIILSALSIRLPNPVHAIVANIAPANGALAMFMIGTMLEINLDRKMFRSAAAVIIARVMMATLLSVIFFRLSPYPYEVRKGLVLVCWSPISSISAPYTEELGGNASLASFTNSIAVIISILVIPTLSVVL